jgi:hypothetical protein
MVMDGSVIPMAGPERRRSSMNSSNDSRTFDQRDPQNERHPVVATNRARQGVTGHNVRYVLGFGVVGVIVAFVVIWLIYFA